MKCGIKNTTKKIAAYYNNGRILFVDINNASEITDSENSELYDIVSAVFTSKKVERDSVEREVIINDQKVSAISDEENENNKTVPHKYLKYEDPSTHDEIEYIISFNKSTNKNGNPQHNIVYHNITKDEWEVIKPDWNDPNAYWRNYDDVFNLVTKGVNGQDYIGASENAINNTNEYSQRILSWLSDENLQKAQKMSRDEIFELFGNKPEAIAEIPNVFLNYLGSDITDNRVYSGMGYFIDPAVNHHPNIEANEYLNIQKVLDDPDEVKMIEENSVKSIVFIKKLARNNAVIVQVERASDGKIIWHKSFFEQKKKPYANKGIQLFPESPEGGVSSISHTQVGVPYRSLPVLDDSTKVEKNPKNKQDKSKKKNNEDNSEVDSLIKSKKSQKRFRLADQTASRPIDMESELKWLRRVLPQLSDAEHLRIVETLRHVGQHGENAWGMSLRGMITPHFVATVA